MAEHFKRSSPFNRELSRLREKLRANTLDTDERSRLIEILEQNTTDSPRIVKAANDEPVFVLRGQDELASGVVLSWANRYADHYWKGDGTLPAENQAAYSDALECAHQMVAFPGRRIPN